MADRSPLEGLGADLVDRYLAGECTEAEAAQVRRHLMANPDAARLLARLAAALDGASGTTDAPPDARASWEVLRGRMRAADGAGQSPAPSAASRVTTPSSSPSTSPAHRPRRSFEVPRVRAFISWGPAVAAIAATVLAAVALERSTARRPAPPDRAAGVYATAAMQRAEIHLADGTRVRMAPASRLRVATDFGDGRRDVYLEGEAYFEVAHDERPFTVYAGNASARDLGTAFSVRSYAEDSAVRVVVREGEVALSGVGRLAAGDVGRLTSTGGATLQRDADVDALLGWLDGRHGYVDAPLAQVLRDLRRWYDVDVALQDSTHAALPFTGVVSGASPAAAVDLVASTVGLTVRRAGGRTVLHPTPGRTPSGPAPRSSR